MMSDAIVKPICNLITLLNLDQIQQILRMINNMSDLMSMLANLHLTR